MFGIPLFFALKCLVIVFGQCIFCAVGSLSGPFLAFAIPGYMMKYNNSNPIEMWTNARMSLKEGFNICKVIDKKTTEMSFSKVMILILKCCFESIVEKKIVSHIEMKMARNKN